MAECEFCHTFATEKSRDTCAQISAPNEKAMSANTTGAAGFRNLEETAVAQGKPEDWARALHERNEEGEDEGEVAQFNDHSSGLQPHVTQCSMLPKTPSPCPSPQGERARRCNGRSLPPRPLGRGLG